MYETAEEQTIRRVCCRGLALEFHKQASPFIHWRNTEVPNINKAKTSARKLFVALRWHHNDGELHSNAVRSRLGWVYEKFEWISWEW